MKTPIPAATDRRARTGSNLPRTRLASLRLQRAADLHAEWRTFSKSNPREARQIGSKADLRRLASSVAKAKAEWQAANLRSSGEATEWEARRQAVRRKLERSLARELPRFREVRRSQSASAKKFSNWLARLRLRFPVGVLAPDEPGEPAIYRAPFPLHDVRVVLGPEDHIDVTDRSFTLPETGQLIIDSEFDNDEHTSFSDGLWGLLYLNGAEVMVSCGVPHRVPRDGRIRIDAELRNFYNHGTLSLKDNWGFSNGVLVCSSFLFGSVIRPSRESLHRQSIVMLKLESDGDNKSDVMPDIEQTVHRLSLETEETFAAGENVWVMVGVSVDVFSKLDDMHSHVRALQWWQLDQIAVSTIPRTLT